MERILEGQDASASALIDSGFLALVTDMIGVEVTRGSILIIILTRIQSMQVGHVTKTINDFEGAETADLEVRSLLPSSPP